MNNGAPTELGTRKISTLLKQYAIPGIIAMAASSLYNMVDSIYIGNIPEVGAYAISGLAVTFPIMNMSAAIGTLVGVGASTMVSMLLGQRNYEKAKKVLGNVMTLNTVLGLAFGFGILAFLEPVLRFFGATDNTLPYAADYMTYILIGNAVTHLYLGLNSMIRASGNPKTAMGLTLFTVCANAILDPILIFGAGMGIKGAAIATVFCQLLALCYTLYFFSNKKRIIHFEKGVFGWNWRIAKASLSIGIGPFLMNFASCIVSLFINQQLLAYGGDLAIGSYGIANRITFLFLMICMGFNQGMQPIASYNWGARQYSRVKEVFKLTTACVAVVTILCFLISVLCPGTVVSIFTSDPVLKEHAAYGLRTMNLAIGIIAPNLVAANFYQNIGMIKQSIVLSLSRQLLVLVPLIYILPRFFQEAGVWYAFPISDIFSLIIAIIFLTGTFKKFDKLEDAK
ncbi:MAG: MATE family efflux transporter [Candidatus Cryptobacteroides sp.]